MRGFASEGESERYGCLTQIMPIPAMLSHCGSAPVQSLGPPHSSEQKEPPSGPSTHSELAQSSPTVQGSIPFRPVPRGPASQKHPFVSSHSQRSDAMQSRLNVHGPPGDASLAPPPSVFVTPESPVLAASPVDASGSPPSLSVPDPLEDEEQASAASASIANPHASAKNDGSIGFIFGTARD